MAEDSSKIGVSKLSLLASL